jgi:hypothetical protein
MLLGDNLADVLCAHRDPNGPEKGEGVLFHRVRIQGRQGISAHDESGASRQTRCKEVRQDRIDLGELKFAHVDARVSALTSCLAPDEPPLQFQRSASVLQERSTKRRKFRSPSPRAENKFPANRPFERLDLLADGRLGNIESVGSPPHASAFGNRKEQFELAGRRHRPMIS